MLKFELAIDDVLGGATQWRSDNGRWTVGASWFEPFHNLALEHMLMAGRGRVVVIVRERVPDACFTHTVMTDASRQTVHATLSQTLNWPADFVILDVQSGRVNMTCGCWGSAPLYLAAGANALSGSWDILDLRGRITQASLDTATVIRLLTLQPRYSTTTICRDIRRLTERAHARWEPGKPLWIDAPLPGLHYLPRELNDDTAALPVYAELLRSAVGRRAIAGEDVVIELSGGTDSATIAVAARDVWAGGRLASYGLLVGGTAGAQQVMRREALVELAKLSDVTIDALRYPPLSPARDDVAVAPFEEPYQDAVVAALQEAPQSVVFTGIGGDELFALRPEERPRSADRPIRGATVRRGLLTADARERAADLAAEPDELPLSMLHESALLASLVRAPVFMRAGRWPVSPLCDPQLIQFGEWLPRRWREGKRLPREWLASRGLLPEAVWPRRRESFMPVMQQGLRMHGLPQLERMLEDGSVLVDLGYIDADAVRRFLDNARFAARRGDEIDIGVHELLALERELATLL